MKISNHVLDGYIPHSFSNISHYRAEYKKDNQIFIGTNGSGKTSTVNMLSPLPQTKSLFLKGGLLSITLFHKGDEYVITSDFSKKSGNHSFIKNGTELNVSGTSQVQKDLVNTHLNYTPTLEKILHGKVKFTQMSKSERKEILFYCSPIDLGFIVEKYKIVSKKLRAVKNNLNMLYKRKAQLESEMIEKSVLDEKKKKYSELQKTGESVQSAIFEIKGLLNGFDSKIDHSLNESEILQKTTDFKRSVIGLDFSKVRDKLFKEEPFILKYTKELAETSVKIDTLANSIKEKSKKLSSFEEYCSSSSFKELSDMENRLKELKTELSEKIEAHDSFIIGEKELDRAIDFSHKLFNEVGILENLDYSKIVRPSILKKLDRKVDTIRFEVERLESEKERIYSDYKKYDEKYKRLKISNPPDNCNLDTCILKKNFKGEINEILDEREKYALKLKEILPKLKRYKNALSKLLTFKANVSDVTESVSKIRDIISENRGEWIFELIDKKDFIKTLRVEPYLLLKKVKETIEISIDEKKRKELLKEKNSLIEEITKRENKNLPSRETLLELISELKKTIKEERENLDREIKLEQYSKVELELLSNMFSKRKEYEDLKRDLHYLYKNQIIKGTKKFYERLKRELEYFLRDNVNSNLIEIEATIKKQDSLLDRYENEIKKSIEELEEERELLSPIEEALSPDRGLPNKLLVDSLQKLINNVNYFIQNMWSYQMKLTPLPKDKPVSFSFPLRIHSKVNSDISNCSEGQKNVINLAFTLALLVHLGETGNYPIFLDEPDSNLDSLHREKMLEFLSKLVSNKLVSQLFLINHHAVIHDGFSESNTVCLNSKNILVPEKYNEFVELS